MIGLIVNGVIGGLAYSLVGVGAKPGKEDFDWGKLIPTLVISGVVGGIAGLTGQDFGVILNGSVAITATVIVQKGWKAILKLFKK